MTRKPGSFRSPACFAHELEQDSSTDRAGDVRIKRIYAAPAPDDGFRVLVDRIWPRGLSRKRAALDAWLRDVAPSPVLRKWFGHEPARWSEFRERYVAELAERAELLEALSLRAARERLTLLYAARDPEFNHAIVLAEAVRRSHARQAESARSTGGSS